MSWLGVLGNFIDQFASRFFVCHTLMLSLRSISSAAGENQADNSNTTYATQKCTNSNNFRHVVYLPF